MSAEVCCFEGGFRDRLRIRGDCEQGVDGEANIASVNIHSCIVSVRTRAIYMLQSVIVCMHPVVWENDGSRS